MEEYFKADTDGRNMAIIESLNLNYKKHNNIVTHTGKTFTWKDAIVNYSVKNQSSTLSFFSMI